MATRDYCTNMAEELEVWSEKLHNLSDKIDHIPSIQKFHLQPLIEELHIIMTELDDRLCDMVNSCSTVEGYSSMEDKNPVTFKTSSRELFDYDFGG